MTLGVGVIGLGFMGATHIRAYRAANLAGFPNSIAAVADPDAARLTGRALNRGNITTASSADDQLFEPAQVFTTTDPLRVIEHPAVQLVSICTPTDTHADLAIAALDRGKHVLIEKPVAINAAEVLRVKHAADRSRGLCMPAMCVRFWPGWDWLKARVDDQLLGRVRSAVLTRLGTRPAWSPFYADDSRCGGALFDLHIHDADFVRYLFGTPDRVQSTGSQSHLTTLYQYQSGPEHVAAEGGWVNIEGFGFRMRYTVVFDHAVADFDLSREPRLTLTRGGQGGVETVAIDTTITGYDAEIRALLAAIEQGNPSPVSIDDALAVTRLLEAELSSLAQGAAVGVTDPKR